MDTKQITQENPDNNEVNKQTPVPSSSENQYGTTQYWENRYKKTNGARFDWLENFQTVYALMLELLGSDKEQRILNVGCGNGEIQDDLYAAGYRNIVNNDISEEVIRQMNLVKEQKDQQGMTYEVMDVTAMTYAPNSFNFILDKSTIDALLCSQHPFLNTARMLESIHRILTPSGMYLCISYAERLEHLKRRHVGFDIESRVLERVNDKGVVLRHYAYLCKKKEIEPVDLQIFYKKLEEEQRAYYE